MYEYGQVYIEVWVTKLCGTSVALP